MSWLMRSVRERPPLGSIVLSVRLGNHRGGTRHPDLRRGVGNQDHTVPGSALSTRLLNGIMKKAIPVEARGGDGGQLIA
jgi:hypothetical protein